MDAAAARDDGVAVVTSHILRRAKLLSIPLLYNTQNKISGKYRCHVHGKNSENVVSGYLVILAC